ncbi:MAG: SDR family NAD(P)-dependent oxidoreductase [Bacteroidales bacterium]|nr:SDR family NAD(P)-dependent oxidoreductase [Bacteroidales bacterium]
MNYFFITGTSSGIGFALANEILKNENNYIIGFSRNNNISHQRYEHINLDLSKPEIVKNYKFIDIIDAESVTLINNSGVIGDVKHIGNIDNNSIISTFNVNSISPAILINNFIKTYKNFSGKKIIINISSGAARHAIESWSSYCASKSALDMFSLVAKADSDKKLYGFKIFSIAPGIVDTNMQNQIRETDKNDFSLLNTFVQYKNDNLLEKPQYTANQLVKIIKNPEKYNNVILDLREI